MGQVERDYLGGRPWVAGFEGGRMMGEVVTLGAGAYGAGKGLYYLGTRSFQGRSGLGTLSRFVANARPKPNARPTPRVVSSSFPDIDFVGPSLARAEQRTQALMLPGYEAHKAMHSQAGFLDIGGGKTKPKGHAQNNFNISSSEHSALSSTLSSTSQTTNSAEPHLRRLFVEPEVINRSHQLSGKTSTKRIKSFMGEISEGRWPDGSLKVILHEEKYYLLDGHHRLAAAKKLNTKVPIEIVEDIRIYECDWNTIEELVADSQKLAPDRLTFKFKEKIK